MSHEPASPAGWPQADPGAGVARWFIDGAWAGLAAAIVGAAVLLAAQLFRDHLDSQAAVEALRMGARGLGVGPLFAWLTRRVGSALVPLALAYALALGFAWGASDAAMLVPIAVYGVTLGLVLGALRRSPPTT